MAKMNLGADMGDVGDKYSNIDKYMDKVDGFMNGPSKHKTGAGPDQSTNQGLTFLQTLATGLGLVKDSFAGPPASAPHPGTVPIQNTPSTQTMSQIDAGLPDLGKLVPAAIDLPRL